MNDIEVEEALILPTSFAQQRLWFLAELEPNHPAYNIYRALHITGPLNRDALEQSLQCIIQRHETLRTTFVVVDGVPMQSIASALHFSLPVIDLDSAEFECVALQEVRKPFNLAHGPLLRASLWRLDEQTHILLLTLHHIITDGWSMEVFFRELATFYQATVAADTVAATSLPALPIQYADYALWEQEWLQGEVLAEQLSYWRKHLAGAPALLNLPTDHPRPHVQSYRGAHHTFLLPQTMLDQIHTLAQREGVTPFMILLAAFQVLLMRYSGQTDIVVGIPFANRTQAEVTGLMGFFANTLALRLSFPEHASFQHILQQVREITVEAYAHQELPFEKVVEDLQPERNRSYNPLVQVAFSFYEAVQPSPALPGLTTHFLEGLTNTSSKFDLSMLALPPAVQQQTLPGTPNDGLMLEWEYNTDLFEATTIQRMATHYATLLQSAVSQPGQHVTDIPLLTEEERRQVLQEWNATDTAYPRQMCVHQLVEAQAEQTPNAIAVTFEGQHLTYRELNIRANQLARYVSLLGVGPEVLVGLCLERSLTLVIAALAILKAGGAYVPLDPTSPPERLAFMLSDAGTPVLLTQENLRLDVSRCSAHVLYLDQLETDLVQQEQENLTNTVTAQNLAYAIYTSGSTGQPKGVPITHQNVLNLVSWHTRTFGLTAQDRASHLAGLSFDATVWEMWPYLASGACLILAPEQARFSPTLLQAWLLAQHVTLSFVPTPLAEPLLQLPWPAQTSLRWLLTGGDRLQHFPPATLPFLFSNNYGPTENTVVATSLVVAAQKQADVLGLDAPSIGYPIANTQAYVLDTHLQPVPIGVPGELCIGGESLTRGYLHLPAITAERFIPDPFSTKVGARLYRTGDKVRYLPDGSLAFLGRLDFQVKIRGFRIELGEIESLLHQHPLVEETVTLAQESSPGEMRLVAYVVLKQTARATSSDLRNFLKDRLPEYMLPTHFVFLDALPLTPNGKVDRRSLPEPTWAEDQQEYEAPRTPIQAGIAQIWAQILRREQVGIHENFFALGGHSLLATQVISRVRQTFQVELPLYALFEAPTVAGLAEQVENVSRSEQSQLLPPLSPCSREGLPPLSFAQEGLWFLDQLRLGLAAYNILEAFRLHGPLNIFALEQSVYKIIQRHEVLRTTFAMRDGHLVQIIAPELQITLHLSDLLHLAPVEREAEATRLLKEEARRPFDLSKGEGGSLLRMSLLHLADEAYVFNLVMHHSISDAWSMNIFYRELTALYNACVAGQSSPLPEVVLHAADVAVWQHQWLQGAVLDEQLGYWREHLRGVPALLNLPTDRPRPAVQRFCGAMTSAWTLPQSLVSALHELSQHEGTTLFMTLLAAFQVLLLRSSGQEDLVVGTPISNRSQIEMEGVMGYLLNTLALRCQLGGDPRFCDVLKQVREVALGAYAHQDVPFEKVVEALQPERTLSHSPLFQVMFVLQTATGDLNLTGLQTTPLEVATATAKFDLTLFVMEKGNGLDVSVEYNTDLFDADTIERLVGHYQQILNEIVTQPEQRISTLTFLTEAEQEQLRIWNATGTDYPHVRALHELVEQQVERTPDMIALAFEDQQCTYSELNARANQLAHFLQHLGIGPDTPVGMCLERSIEMVVGVLGILKAGGVYVPLDPNYPAERLAFMLSDTQAPVLLTQQSLVGRLPTQDVRHILCLDAEWHTIAAQSDENPDTSLQTGNLAYIIYTSGSTGTPKGVAMPHAALVNLFTWQQHSSAFPLGARTLQFASLNFDVASQEIFCTIGFGQTLVLLSENVRRDPLAMLTLIAREGIARLFLPVVVLQQLAECAVTERSLHMPNALREIITAGEQLQITPQVVHLFGMLPNTTLSNHYGPSESHVVSSSLLTGDPRVWPVLPHIGRPIDNVELYVLDTYGQRVPLGVPGDLLIGGTSLARGYLARPDVTAERFIPHPFSSIPGARLYKTGDLACYLPDGNIQFLGRGDTQVKVRGYRIELGEIEAMLATHPCVRESVVIVREDIPTEKRLVAYVVSQDEQAQIATQLRHFLQGKLPEYMIPSAFILLDALPVTANGKVDQRVLPAPEKMEAVREVMYEAPRTPVEEVLVRIWTQVLHKEQVGIRDNFFALGGHSLLATQAISHMRQTFQTDIPLLYLFEAPTIAGLAETLLTSETVPGRIAMIATYRQKIERMSGDEKQVFLQKTKNARG